MDWHIPDIDIAILMYAYKEVMRWLQANIPSILLVTNAISALKVWAYSSLKVPDNKIFTLIKEYTGFNKVIKLVKPFIKKDFDVWNYQDVSKFTVFDIAENTIEGQLLSVAIIQLMESGATKYKSPDEIVEFLKQEVKDVDEYWRKIHAKD